MAALFLTAGRHFKRLQPLPNKLVGDADRQRQRTQYALEIKQQLALIAERDTRSVMTEDAAASKPGAAVSNETAQQAAA